MSQPVSTGSVILPPPSVNKPPTSLTTNVAQRYIRTAHSTSQAPPLVGAAPDFDKELKSAELKLLEGDLFNARSMFQELLSRIKQIKLPEFSFHLVRCHLGLASSYMPGADQSQHAKEAYSGLKNLFDVRNTVTRDISPFHSILRWHLKKLKPLMPEAAADIDAKIKTCGHHILKIDTFKELLNEADELRQKKNSKCRETYKKALELIDKENGIEFKIATVKGLLRFISTYKNGHSDTVPFRARTQTALFDLYHLRGSIAKTVPCTEVEAFECLYDFLKLLLSFTPPEEKENREEIEKRMSVCNTQIDVLCKANNPVASPSTTGHFLQNPLAATTLHIASVDPPTDTTTPAPTLVETATPVPIASSPTPPAAQQQASLETTPPVRVASSPPPLAAQQRASVETPLPDKPLRKVTRDPPGVYDKLEGLFIYCIVITLVAVAGMALYRRHTVKLSE
ncbi:MAG TPA: hypothetical protein VHK67_07385 [Rhabdochlamydiaceae bacterium]|jgi:hypothetical protein|nr:hypothetical protein [Rhabdochlamydiaceae bacterium]